MGADLGFFARGGEWSERYGTGTVAGGRVELGFGKQLYVIPKGSVFFGTNVNEDPLASLRDTNGRIIGDVSIEGRPSDLSLRSRGYQFAGLVGIERPLGKSGAALRGAAGPSYTVHYIRIQDDPTITTTNLREDYKRGYDRRAGGFGASLEAGASYTNLNGSLKVFAVAHLDVINSKALNSTQFDVKSPAPTDGVDVGYGARIGFLLGLRRNARGSADDIYY